MNRVQCAQSKVSQFVIDVPLYLYAQKLLCVGYLLVLFFLRLSPNWALGDWKECFQSQEGVTESQLGGFIGGFLLPVSRDLRGYRNATFRPQT